MAFAPSPPDNGRRDIIGEEEEGEEDRVVPMLVAGYKDGTVRVFDVNTVEMQLKLHPHSTSVTAIAFSADGMCLVSWNLGSGNERIVERVCVYTNSCSCIGMCVCVHSFLFILLLFHSFNTFCVCRANDPVRWQ